MPEFRVTPKNPATSLPYSLMTPSPAPELVSGSQNGKGSTRPPRFLTLREDSQGTASFSFKDNPFNISHNLQNPSPANQRRVVTLQKYVQPPFNIRSSRVLTKRHRRQKSLEEAQKRILDSTATTSSGLEALCKLIPVPSLLLAVQTASRIIQTAQVSLYGLCRLTQR